MQNAIDKQGLEIGAGSRDAGTCCRFLGEINKKHAGFEGG